MDRSSSSNRSPPPSGSGATSGYDADVLRQLCKAAQDGDTDTLKIMLASNPRLLRQFIASPLSTRETPLHVSVEEGHRQFTRRILLDCPDLTSRRVGKGCLPIHLAVANEREELVKLLLAYGHPDDCYKRDDRGWLPIHVAAVSGHDRILKEVLNHGHSHSDYNRYMSHDHCSHLLWETLDGDNALHLCIKNNNKLDALEVLVEFALSKNDKEVLRCANQDGLTIMHLAVLKKQNKAVRYLLQVLGEDGVRMLNEGVPPSVGFMDQFSSTQDFRIKDIENLLSEAGFQASTDPENDERGVWYRSTAFRTFDYDPVWLRQAGSRMLPMGQVILQSIVQIITWLGGRTKDQSTSNLRNRLSDSACICGVASLVASMIVLMTGKNLAKNKFWGLLFVISMFAVVASFGFAFVEMVYLTSFSKDKHLDRTWEATIFCDVLVAFAGGFLFIAGVLRLIRFFMERRYRRNV